ncbi:ABC transporter ATP-binding protein [Rhodobacteraceae bacterium N5(2021)]|uniref:ABC transporter ATP-binding protein n=1 Tax=Gymnodinialimonas phycosphaerae TaxID=2841589 RepID=A0A975TST2_9RHOB|nr:ABC transporter ATP-binding protein [Gymnodinialimonas phycosphaerae]MBY4893521.1 ABC transporter ATP-binding protein [Gymnodinialimonas phycosphaerae]
MSTLHLDGIAKSFGDATALHALSLSVADGEFVTLLGPSGCGKTTLMRIIAGITQPDRGEIRIDGRAIHALPPERRNIGLVFQSYALFPHMTVAANVGFGLKMRGIARADADARVAAALDLVDLGAFAERYPKALSGGQQQRVALARAVVIEPDILLFDEPLSNLDAKLRDQLRDDLKVLQRRLGITAIYVTHDQAEAMALADRILVMQAGRIIEEGAPVALYRQPRTRFAAEFLGQTNVLPVVRQNGQAVLPWGQPIIAKAAAEATHVSLRPEDIAMVLDPEGPGEVRSVTFLGASVECRVAFGDLEIRMRDTGSGVALPAVGQRVSFNTRTPPHPLGEVELMALP